MASNKNTAVDPDALRKAADKLADLGIDNILNKVDDLRGRKLEAGTDGTDAPDKFDAAIWLEAVVKDRFDGIYYHARSLKSAFESLGVTLKKVARIFEDTDSSGAVSLQGKATTEINDWISDVKYDRLPDSEGRDSYDRTTEDGSRMYKGFEINGMDGSYVPEGGDKDKVKIFWDPERNKPIDIAGDYNGHSLDPDELFADAREIGDRNAGDEEFAYRGGLVDKDEKNTTEIIIDTKTDPDN